MVTIPGYKDIQEGYPTLLLPLHGELDVRSLLIEVLVEPGQFFSTMLPDDDRRCHPHSKSKRQAGMELIV